MVDQLSGCFFKDGMPEDWLHVPHLRALADRSLKFANGYSPSPLCTPARGAFMSGLLPSQSGIYDNAAEFPSMLPTYAHLLRGSGYHTALIGKMHFIGADQYHGFEERYTTDIYPADFGWTPDYQNPNQRVDWWYHNMSSVEGAGVALFSNQLEYDDEISYHAVAKIYDYARKKEDRPWSLTISFTHPHDPYITRQKYWDLYEDCAHLDPAIAAIPYDRQDSHSKRLMDAVDYKSYPITDDHIRRARRAYFGNISYLDDQIGSILSALEQSGQEAMIIFLSDHGDMLGDRGLWYKMNFFEGSARIPMMIAHSSLTASTRYAPVSSLDIMPTVLDFLNLKPAELPNFDQLSGESLLNTSKRSKPVIMEYAAEGSVTPMTAIRHEDYKYIHCLADAPMLFNLKDDPLELHNLAGQMEAKETQKFYLDWTHRQWDFDRFHNEVLASQKKRHFVYNALRQGKYQAWDFQPLQDATNRYMRNHMDLNIVESSQRVKGKSSD